MEEAQTRSGPRRLEELDQYVFPRAGTPLPVATHYLLKVVTDI